MPRVERQQQPFFKSICREHSPAEAQPTPTSFKPIGDVCSCGKQLVKPAPLPDVRQQKRSKFSISRPSCSCSSSNHGDDSSSSDHGKLVRAPARYQNFDNDGATIYFETSKKKSAEVRHRSAPADVVSIALAKRLANNARNVISERNLQYGSLKHPKHEEKEHKTQRVVNEELFYDTKGSILELKPHTFRVKPQISSEESSEEKKARKHASKPFHPADLDFEAIGYKTYEAAKPKYVVVKNSEPVKHECKKQQRRNRPHHHFSSVHNRKDNSCGCHKDLVVDQSEVSEQSMSFESSNDHHNHAQFST